MFSLNLPAYSPRLKKVSDKLLIFDIVRQRFVALTPEEWVRQNFVNYLIKHLEYPKGLIANELQIKLAQTNKRCDTLVYDKSMKPLVLIEYKAPTVLLSEKTTQQIGRYNMVLHVPFLFISNGIEHHAYALNTALEQYVPLDHIPSYTNLLLNQSTQI